MGILPLYSIHQYSEEIYKVVAFKGTRDPENPRVRDKEKEQHYDAKLNEGFCRAKSLVLQYALCNPWDWFFTGTLDKTKFNRYDLDEYQQKLSQFIRDKRKAYGTQVQYLLIPEHHKDGAWHIHGLLSGLPDNVLRRFRPPEPWDLVNSDYMNWTDYMDKFGFCSLGRVNHPVATAFYITKYVSKELSLRGKDVGKHLYFHSRPLRKAEHASNVYFYNSGLEAVCIHDHDFCKTGMVQDATWMFPYQWYGVEAANEIPLDPPKPLEPEAGFRPGEIAPFFEQMSIF